MAGKSRWESLPRHPRFAPDEYQVVVGSQSWHTAGNASGIGNHGHEDRRGIRVLKSLRQALVNPIFGLGGGYFYRPLSRHGDYEPFTRFTIRSSLGCSLF